MKCKYFDCGWCCAPIDVVTSASSCGSCNYPEHCPYLKTEMSEKKFTIEPEAIEDIYLMSGIELPTNKKQRNREKNLIRSGYEMAYQNQQPEVMSSGTAIISDENGVPTKVHLSDKEKLTEMTKKMDTVESIEAQIKMLQSKLEFYKELEKTKTPVEEAYKDWWGQYPETGTWDGFDEKRWQGFQAGYEFAYAISTAKEVMEKVQEEPKDNEWKSVALRFGEELVSIGPCGYYEFTAEEWFDWVVNTYEKICDDTVKLLKKENLKKAQERGERVHKDVERCVRESVKWCEEHPNTDPLDWLKPQTPKETEQSLKEAFVKAQQTEKWKEIQKLIDEEDNDKNFKNSLDLIKEWGEKNKPRTLYQICMEWWNEVFVNQMDDDICVDVLVSKIDKEFIPPSSEKNGYEWEKCLKRMRDNLR